MLELVVVEVSLERYNRDVLGEIGEHISQLDEVLVKLRRLSTLRGHALPLLKSIP